MRLRPVVVFLVVALLGGSIAAQSVDPALTAAIAGRDQAAIKRDPAAMAKYTADDYASINPSGQLMSKKQRVDGLKVPAAPGSKPGTPLRTEAVHMYGSGAAVARMKQDGNRQLTVWIKNPSGWQVVAIHVAPDTFMPQPPPEDRPKTAPASNVPSQPGLTGDRAAVFAVFKQIQDAFFAGDRATYDKLAAPEHVRMNPGVIRFAGEGSTVVDGPRTPPKYSNVTVQVWDPLAVVRWHETNPAGRQTWLTRVFAKKGSGWQAVATASSLSGNPSIAP